MRFSKDKKRMLIKELRKIFNDKEFVLGVLCDLDSDKDIETLLTFIKQNDNIKAQDIILFSLKIAEENEKTLKDLVVDDFFMIKNNAEIKK